MAEQRQTYNEQQPTTVPIERMLPARATSKSQILAVVTLLPVGGTLLLLSGLTLAGTLTGLGVATPLFVIFSPVLVPAALVIGLAVAGFLTSGAFGVTGLSSFSWMVNYIWKSRVPDQMEKAKKSVKETAGTKETGKMIQSKAQKVENDEGQDVK